MAAKVVDTTKKIVLDLEEGTQTISPILESATDDAIFETGSAIGALQKEPVENIQLVVTETIQG